MDITPQYEHTCSDCVFLGRIGSADLYRHCMAVIPPSEGGCRGFLLRYSNEPSDYWSNSAATWEQVVFELMLNPQHFFSGHAYKSLTESELNRISNIVYERARTVSYNAYINNKKGNPK